MNGETKVSLRIGPLASVFVSLLLTVILTLSALTPVVADTKTKPALGVLSADQKIIHVLN
jgi:hypothetical protein